MRTKKLLGLAALSIAIVVGCEDSGSIISEQSDNSALIPQTQQKTQIDNQYIVRLKESNLKMGPGVDRIAAVKSFSETLLSNYKINPEAAFRHYGYSITGFAAKISEEEAKRLANDDRVLSVEPDHIVMLAPPPGKGPNKDDGGGDGGGDTSAQSTPWGITRVNGGATVSGKTAWILDSGVDLDHPDLNVDTRRSVTFISSGKDARSADDGNGHGTHCAGTIAAIDNNIGVVGVAAGATVVGVKVLDRRGSGSYSGVIAGVDYVAANGSAGDVANMSLGGPASQALDDAISAASQGGVVFVLAAGNEAQFAGNVSPARVNGPNILTVSAMDINDNFAYFSNYGNPPVDYCAPGVSVESTWKNGGYNTISGTSMAAPHVAGLVLLGNISNGGTVNGDPDGSPDPIAVN